MRSILPHAALLLLCISPACSSGGSRNGLSGKEKLTANQYLFGFVGRPSFPAFPTTSADIQSVDGRFFFKDDGTYEMRQSDGTLLSQSDYQLDSDGTLAIAVPTSTTTLVYRGAYGLLGPTGDVFLTDRVGSGVGVYFGTTLVQGNADLAPLVGDWRMFSLHSILAPGGSVPDEDLVGVALGGSLTLAADGSFTGTAVESENGAVTVTGTANDFQAFADGKFTVEMTIDPPTRPDYQRGFVAGGGARFLAGVDPDSGGADDAAGILLMLRKRTASYAIADLAGKYTLGMLTLFIKPSASGTDSSIGTLELTTAGNFRIDATNNAGQAFSYTGTFTANADGGLTFAVSGTNETWQGAFDDGYHTIVFVDAFKEVRPSLQKELNLGMAVRPKPTTP
ncbi:MAG: hypothetical protein U1F36_07480 [Planctomycetota bacterium]